MPVVELPGLDRRWVATGEVARRLGVSTRTVERWRAGGCPCLARRGTVRFQLAEVEAWLRAR
jgi:excisionase family DNA binding protein